MAEIIKLKRSAVPGKIPGTGSLVLGELAVNTYDGKVYFKRSGSQGEEILSAFVIGAQNTGSVNLTGSLNVEGDVNATTFDGIDLTSFSSSISGRVDQNEGDIVVLQTASSSFSLRVSDLEVTASDHETRITDLEATASDHETDISGLQTDSASFEGRITTNEQDIVDLQSTASEHETEITDLQATASALSAETFWTGSPDGTISRESDVKITGSEFITGDLTVGGKVTAEEFHTEFVTSSVIFDSGSTKFGDTADDRHEFTGSVEVQGKVTASSVETPDLKVQGISGKEVLYQDGTGSVESVGQPSISGSSLKWDGNKYVFSNIIDGGTF